MTLRFRSPARSAGDKITPAKAELAQLTEADTCVNQIHSWRPQERTKTTGCARGEPDPAPLTARKPRVSTATDSAQGGGREAGRGAGLEGVTRNGPPPPQRREPPLYRGG